MEKLGKKAFLFRITSFLFKIIFFMVFIIVIILLVFLIKNDWNVGTAINEFIEFIKKSKEQISG